MSPYGTVESANEVAAPQHPVGRWYAEVLRSSEAIDLDRPIGTPSSASIATEAQDPGIPN